MQRGKRYFILMSSLPMEFVKPKSPGEEAIIDKIILVCSALNNLRMSVVPFEYVACRTINYHSIATDQVLHVCSNSVDYNYNSFYLQCMYGNNGSIYICTLLDLFTLFSFVSVKILQSGQYHFCRAWSITLRLSKSF